MQFGLDNIWTSILNSVSIIIQNVPNLIIATVIIIITIFLIKIVKRSVKSAGVRADLPLDVTATLNKLLQWTILLIVFIIILNIFGLEQFWLATIIPIMFGTVIGFASISTIGNMVAGLIIMFSRPFKVGDLIQIGEDIAEVKEITIIFTKVEKGDGIVHIPNAEFLKNKITNYDQKPAIIRMIKFSASYEHDVSTIESIVLKAVSGVKGVLEFLRPNVRVDNFDDFACQYKLIYYIQNFRDRGRIEGDIRKNSFQAFKANGIDLTTSHLVNITGGTQNQ